MLYVGQTSQTCCERFREHIRAARRHFQNGTETDIFHRAIARHGWKHLSIFPIEHISGSFPRTKIGRTQFRMAALPRETFWKRVLQAFAPQGLCLEGKSSIRRNRGKIASAVGSIARAQNTPAIASTRQYLSRDLSRKISFLFSQVSSGRFLSSDLSCHSQRNLARMHDKLFSTRPAFWNANACAAQVASVGHCCLSKKSHTDSARPASLVLCCPAFSAPFFGELRLQPGSVA